METQVTACSKCEEPSERALLVPGVDNGVRIVRLCAQHWHEVEALLSVAA